MSGKKWIETSIEMAKRGIDDANYYLNEKSTKKSELVKWRLSKAYNKGILDALQSASYYFEVIK